MDYLPWQPQHTVRAADLKMVASWYLFFKEILPDNLPRQELSQGSQDKAVLLLWLEVQGGNNAFEENNSTRIQFQTTLLKISEAIFVCLGTVTSVLENMLTKWWTCNFTTKTACHTYFFQTLSQRNAQIMNPKNPDLNLIRWIHPEYGFNGFKIHFRILVKKHKIWFWILPKKCSLRLRNAFSCTFKSCLAYFTFRDVVLFNVVSILIVIDRLYNL